MFIRYYSPDSTLKDRLNVLTNLLEFYYLLVILKPNELTCADFASVRSFLILSSEFARKSLSMTGGSRSFLASYSLFVISIPFSISAMSVITFSSDTAVQRNGNFYILNNSINRLKHIYNLYSIINCTRIPMAMLIWHCLCRLPDIQLQTGQNTRANMGTVKVWLQSNIVYLVCYLVSISRKN